MPIEEIKQDLLLDFWFGECSDERPMDRNSPRMRSWFSENPQTVRSLRENFEQDLAQAKAGAFTDWQSTVRGRLALIVLWDQVSRRLYKGTPRAFEADEMALSLCLRSLNEHADETLLLFERLFFYMPLAHSESFEIQQKSLQAFRRLAEAGRRKSPANSDYFFDALDRALKKYAQIESFGRFPARNRILGRLSTSEELEFLKTSKGDDKS